MRVILPFLIHFTASSVFSGVIQLEAPAWSPSPQRDGHHFSPIGVMWLSALASWTLPPVIAAPAAATAPAPTAAVRMKLRRSGDSMSAVLGSDSNLLKIMCFSPLAALPVIVGLYPVPRFAGRSRDANEKKHSR